MTERTTQDETSGSALEGISGLLLLLGAMDGDGAPWRLQMLRLEGELPIGRGEPDGAEDRWLIPGETISRQHARIRGEAGGFYIEDLGSRNGTWVDGTVLRGEKSRLREGAPIVLAGQVAVFRRMSADQIAAVISEQQRPLGPVPTASPLMAVSLRRLRILAATEHPVLLAGETGAGKEVYARALHELSGRSGPFVAVNCASFQRDLFESQLFGYKRGSHSQASEDHPGILSTAEGGTLFLDEIGEMDAALQTKLLRFLQDRTFFGLGARRARQADVRIVAATQSPDRTLRADILGRFGAEAVTLPPLRKRREDLPALCRYFLRQLPAGARALDRAVVHAFCVHRWRRNIRELEATIAEAALSAADRGASRIGLTDLPRKLQELVSARGSDPAPAKVAVEGEADPVRRRPTRPELENLLREHAGQVPEVARRLGRRRELIWRWCRLLEIDPNAFKEGEPPSVHTSSRSAARSLNRR
jgi:transcriptional regulator with PAS, ATPase and Fis domain